MFATIKYPLWQVATAPGAASSPVGDINSTVARNQPPQEWPAPGEDLPDQGGGFRETLQPQIYQFRLPEVLAPLWHDIEVEDRRKYLPSGQPSPTFGQKFKQRVLKLDRNSPLVVVGGPMDGAPMTANFSTAPRPRSFEKNASENPKTPWISDGAYLLDIALNDKLRPVDPKVLEAQINKYGGKIIRLEIGRSAHCRADKIRYIRVITIGEGGKRVEQTIPDGTGKKGCNKRYRTKDFKNPQAGMIDPATNKPIPPYDDEIACDCGDATPAEKLQGMVDQLVVLRGFEQVERFLPPLGQ